MIINYIKKHFVRELQRLLRTLIKILNWNLHRSIMQRILVIFQFNNNSCHCCLSIKSSSLRRNLNQESYNVGIISSCYLGFQSYLMDKTEHLVQNDFIQRMILKQIRKNLSSTRSRFLLFLYKYLRYSLVNSRMNCSYVCSRMYIFYISSIRIKQCLLFLHPMEFAH